MEQKISNRERLDYKLSAFRILHTVPHMHSALFIPHYAFHISAFYRYPWVTAKGKGPHRAGVNADLTGSQELSGDYLYTIRNANSVIRITTCHV